MRHTSFPRIAWFLVFGAATLVACASNTSPEVPSTDGGGTSSDGGTMQDGSNPSRDGGGSQLDTGTTTGHDGATGDGGVCNAACSTNAECGSLCPAPPQGNAYCCDTMTGRCYLSQQSTCAPPVQDSGGMPPPY